MNIVQRAAGILTQPKAEWPRIDNEPTTAGSLMLSYALPLALLPLIGTIIGTMLFMPAELAYLGGGIWTFVIVTGVLGVILGLALLYVMSLIADALAPNFGGVRNPIGAVKLLVYAGTAVWVTAFIGAIIPGVGWLISLLGYAYAAYLIYLGSVSVMKVPPTSAGGYTAVVIIIWIVLSLLVAFIIGLIVFAVVLGGVAAAGAGSLLR